MWIINSQALLKTLLGTSSPTSSRMVPRLNACSWLTRYLSFSLVLSFVSCPYLFYRRKIVNFTFKWCWNSAHSMEIHQKQQGWAISLRMLKLILLWSLLHFWLLGTIDLDLKLSIWIYLVDIYWCFGFSSLNRTSLKRKSICQSSFWGNAQEGLPLLVYMSCLLGLWSWWSRMCFLRMFHWSPSFPCQMYHLRSLTCWFGYAWHCGQFPGF